MSRHITYTTHTHTDTYKAHFVLIIIEDEWFLLSHGMPFDVWMSIVVSESIHIKDSLSFSTCVPVICNASIFYKPSAWLVCVCVFVVVFF